jgi:hypothetical protein
MWKLAGQFAKTVLPGVIKPLHVLWNEMIAFIFLVFAITGAFSVFRSYRAMEGSPEGFGRLILTLVFTLIMGGFAWGSFRRARRISKR